VVGHALQKEITREVRDIGRDFAFLSRWRENAHPLLYSDSFRFVVLCQCFLFFFVHLGSYALLSGPECGFALLPSLPPSFPPFLRHVLILIVYFSLFLLSILFYICLFLHLYTPPPSLLPSLPPSLPTLRRRRGRRRLLRLRWSSSLRPSLPPSSLLSLPLLPSRLPPPHHSSACHEYLLGLSVHGGQEFLAGPDVLREGGKEGGRKG